MSSARPPTVQPLNHLSIPILYINYITYCISQKQCVLYFLLVILECQHYGSLFLGTGVLYYFEQYKIKSQYTKRQERVKSPYLIPPLLINQGSIIHEATSFKRRDELCQNVDSQSTLSKANGASSTLRIYVLI